MVRKNNQTDSILNQKLSFLVDKKFDQKTRLSVISKHICQGLHLRKH